MYRLSICKVAVSAVFFLATTSILAQSEEPGQSSSYLQVKSGVSFASQYTTPYQQAFKPGLANSISYGRRLSNRLLLESGLGFVQRGYGFKSGNITVAGESLNFRYSETMNYISVPLMVGVELGDRVKVRLLQGASADMLTKAYSTFRENETTYINDTYICPLDNGNQAILPYTSKFNRFDVSIRSSASVLIPFGKFYAGAGVQSDFGLLQLVKNECYNLGAKSLTLTTSINIGYRF